MKIYADTSVFVSLYTPDGNSARADEWRRSNPIPLDFTPLHRVEFRNALSLAVFQKRLTTQQTQTAWLAMHRDLASGVLVAQLEIWARVLQEAEKLAESHTPSIGTRTLDVLHVASALVLVANEFFTFDTRQAQLANLVGLHVG